jgi:hypothetical protein
MKPEQQSRRTTEQQMDEIDAPAMIYRSGASAALLFFCSAVLHRP